MLNFLFCGTGSNPNPSEKFMHRTAGQAVRFEKFLKTSGSSKIIGSDNSSEKDYNGIDPNLGRTSKRPTNS